MNEALVALVVILVTLGLFLLGRELVCWYWKLNRIVELLESIERRLGSIDTKDLKLLSKIDNLTQHIPAIVTGDDGIRRDVVIRGKKKMKPADGMTQTQVMQVPGVVVEVDCPYCGKKTEIGDLDSRAPHACKHCGQAFEVTP